jgi:hypothetical protein
VGFVVDKAAPGRFSPSTSVSPANHSTNFSIIINTRGCHNRPIGGRSAEWTQLDSTPPLYQNININVNIILSSTPWFPSLPLFLKFSTKTLYAVKCFSHYRLVYICVFLENNGLNEENVLSRDICVTIDGVWIDEWIYCPLVHMIWN